MHYSPRNKPKGDPSPTTVFPCSFLPLPFLLSSPRPGARPARANGGRSGWHLPANEPGTPVAFKLAKSADGLYYTPLLPSPVPYVLRVDLAERDLHRLEVLFTDVKQPLRRTIDNTQCSPEHRHISAVYKKAEIKKQHLVMSVLSSIINPRTGDRRARTLIHSRSTAAIDIVMSLAAM